MLLHITDMIFIIKGSRNLSSFINYFASKWVNRQPFQMSACYCMQKHISHKTQSVHFIWNLYEKYIDFHIKKMFLYSEKNVLKLISEITEGRDRYSQVLGLSYSRYNVGKSWGTTKKSFYLRKTLFKVNSDSFLKQVSYGICIYIILFIPSVHILVYQSILPE